MLWGLPLMIVVILVLAWSIKKFCPKLTRVKRNVLIGVIAVLMFFFTDFLLTYNHHDPLFAIPVAMAGDGGSTYYIGLLYQIDKEVAYTLGEGSPPFFEYYIAPWFFHC